MEFNYFVLQKVNQFINKVIKVIKCGIFPIPDRT